MWFGVVEKPLRTCWFCVTLLLFTYFIFALFLYFCVWKRDGQSHGVYPQIKLIYLHYYNSKILYNDSGLEHNITRRDQGPRVEGALIWGWGRHRWFNTNRRPAAACTVKIWSKSAQINLRLKCESEKNMKSWMCMVLNKMKWI